MYNLDTEPQIIEPYHICQHCYEHLTHDFLKYKGLIYHTKCFEKLQKRTKREISLFGFSVSLF